MVKIDSQHLPVTHRLVTSLRGEVAKSFTKSLKISQTKHLLKHHFHTCKSLITKVIRKQ